MTIVEIPLPVQNPLLNSVRDFIRCFLLVDYPQTSREEHSTVLPFVLLKSFWLRLYILEKWPWRAMRARAAIVTNARLYLNETLQTTRRGLREIWRSLLPLHNSVAPGEDTNASD